MDLFVSVKEKLRKLLGTKATLSVSAQQSNTIMVDKFSILPFVYSADVSLYALSVGLHLLKEKVFALTCFTILCQDFDRSQDSSDKRT